MAEWGYGTSIFSPVLLILLIASAAWLLFTATAFYTHLRLMGSDERAAYTSGVPITIVRIGAHLISGCFAGLAAICFTALISSGDPSQGTTYTLIAVTALVLGGASLAGGRGGVFGSALGALNLYLITFVLSTFNFGAVQSFVTNLAYGTILVVSLLLTLLIPVIQRHIRNFSPLLYFVALSVVVLGVILHATFDYACPRHSRLPTLPGPLDMQAALIGPLEIATLAPETEALRAAGRAAGLWRRCCWSSSRSSCVLPSASPSAAASAPAVAVVVAALVLAGAWLMTREARTSQTPAAGGDATMMADDMPADQPACPHPRPGHRHRADGDRRRLRLCTGRIGPDHHPGRRLPRWHCFIWGWRYVLGQFARRRVYAADGPSPLRRAWMRIAGR